ncbi:hypothetical protein IGJ02_002706 [Enterococcus sp. DIV0724b]|uniref:hypothetical protein n=1 Tax=Enterococcus sp. DIV0724b TaxID=2774694 RepID=UPI003D2FB0E9
MKHKKKFVHIFWLISVIVLCLVVGSAAAYAAMMVREEKANLFQIGDLQTNVNEVFNAPTTILPGTSVEKKVAIENTGTVNQFVRVMIQPEIRLESSGSIRLLPSKIGAEVMLDLNSEYWKLGEDGYYYYLKALKPGSSNRTETVFNQVTLKKELGSEYQKANFSLLVKAEAINCAKYAYRDAWWQGAVPNHKELQAIDKQLASKAE